MQPLRRFPLAAIDTMNPGFRTLGRWYHQLGQQAEAGLPLAASLRMAGGPPQSDRDALAGRLERGESVESALQSGPAWLRPLDRVLLSSAAQAGRLPEACEELAKRYELLARHALALFLATLYPVMVIHLAAVAVPALSAIDLCGGGLAAFDWPGYFRGMAWILAPVWIGGGLIAWLAARRNRIVLALLRAIPGVGGYLRARAFSETAFIVGSCYRSGVPIADAWKSVGLAVDHPAVRPAAERVARGAAGGHSPGALLVAEKGFPAEFASFYNAGEETGRLAENLEVLRKRFDDAARTRLALVSILYPMILFLVVAGSLGFAILRFYAGYFDMLSGLGT